jgi:broad specificity phosphatase PhoE
VELILVRHGETIWNREGRVQGFSDMDLSDVGVHQARQLALSLKDAPIIPVP